MEVPQDHKQFLIGCRYKILFDASLCGYWSVGGGVMGCWLRGYWGILYVNWEGTRRSMEFDGCRKLGIIHRGGYFTAVSICLVRAFQEYLVH